MQSSPYRRVLASRETWVTILVVVVAMAVCISLGYWQFTRHESRVAARDTITANYDAKPVPWKQLVPSSSATVDDSTLWRTATLTGAYCSDPSCILYVRNRPLNGEVGFWQLVPFTTETETVMVVRGWVPIQSVASEPALTPPVSTDPQTIAVHIRPTEPALESRENPPGQLQTVTASDVEPYLPSDASPLSTGAYGELSGEQVASNEVPYELPRPSTDLGPHLSYAFQWWIFAVFFPVGGFLRIRSQLLDAKDDGGVDRPGSAPHRPHNTPARRTRRRSLDEEEEDALLDG